MIGGCSDVRYVTKSLVAAAHSGRCSCQARDAVVCWRSEFFGVIFFHTEIRFILVSDKYSTFIGPYVKDSTSLGKESPIYRGNARDLNTWKTFMCQIKEDTR